MDFQIEEYIRRIEEIVEARRSDPSLKDGSLSVKICQLDNYPAAGIVTMMTEGVCNYPLIEEAGREFLETRVEFISCCLRHQEEVLRSALNFAAEVVTQKRSFVRPGIFLFELYGRFIPSTKVPHGFLKSPFAFGRRFEMRRIQEENVSWLQVLPVSSQEIEYAHRVSTDALEDIFEKEDIRWEDILRDSCL